MVLLLTVLLAVFPQTGSGPRKKAIDAPQPYARAWRYESPALAGVRAGADAGIVVVPLVDGRFVALSPDDGSLLWSADFGGEASAPPLITTNAVYVATARQGTEADGVLRALDRATGLVLWSRDLAKPIVSELTIAEGRIYCGSADGALYALRADSGSTVWRFATRGPVRGHVAFYATELLFGSDDGALYVVDRESGTEVWRFQTGGPIVGRPATIGRRIVVTSGDGSAYAVDMTTRRLVWRSRTGAAIEAGAVPVGEESVLVASFDNFLYLFDVKTGDRLWKLRMRGRLVSDPVPDGNGRAIVAPIRDDRLTVVGLKDGKRVAAFALDTDEELVGAPTHAGRMLYLPTDTGLLAARAAEAK
jgi:outer membrane protein assembly factor BamB